MNSIVKKEGKWSLVELVFGWLVHRKICGCEKALTVSKDSLTLAAIVGNDSSPTHVSFSARTGGKGKAMQLRLLLCLDSLKRIASLLLKV